MTILAGIISRHSGFTIPEQQRASIKHHISRHSGDIVHERGSIDWYMAKIDIGAFGTAALHDIDERAISMIAGEPLLCSDKGATSRDRNADLQIIHEAITTTEWSALADAAGTFCGVHFDIKNRVLTLFTDKIGLRPIYYYIDNDFIIYASALRILEQIPNLLKTIDLRGVTEIACFGFPLANRTPYENVSTLRAGEIVRINENTEESIEYWRWDRLPPSGVPTSNLPQEARQRFVSAVKRRHTGDFSEVAFLSGGLDSRAIVATLRELDIDTDTLNFAPMGSQDEHFAKLAADALGTRHHHLKKEADSIPNKAQTYNQRAVLKWLETSGWDGRQSSRTRVWSGDGGSVALGHVYLNKNIIDHARHGNLRNALDAFCQYNTLHVPIKLFQREISDEISCIPAQGIEEELERLDCGDRGRAFHLFLMLNDQRRHLFDFYENIDTGRFELELPFFDGDFLELILSSPIDMFLRHEFYMKWLATFQERTMSIPWQAYPGHVQCSLPIPQNLTYQWGDYYGKSTEKQLKNILLDRANDLLSSPLFPNHILNRSRLRIATMLTKFGIRDYSYLIRTASVYCRYWNLVA